MDSINPELYLLSQQFSQDVSKEKTPSEVYGSECEKMVVEAFREQPELIVEVEGEDIHRRISNYS